MTTMSQPWAASFTARLSRALDPDTVEIVEFRHGGFTRRLLGDGGPLAHPVQPLDEQGCRELLEELRAELEAPPADIDRDDLSAFVRLLEGSLGLVPAA